jgi:hypothetical protein
MIFAMSDERIDLPTSSDAAPEPPQPGCISADKTAKTAPRKKGDFPPGVSGNPKGRPRGSLNQSTLIARAILEENAAALTNKAVEQALNGNSIALKICLQRLVPPPHDRTVTIPLPERDASAEDILAAHSAVLRAVSTGEISPQEAHTLSLLLEARRRSWEAVQFSARLADVESRLPPGKR